MKAKTIFIDLDGTTVENPDCPSDVILKDKKFLPNVRKKIDEWVIKDYCIIFTTARPESYRGYTERQLNIAGVPYHHLIMNLPHGARIIINDKDNEGNARAFVSDVERDEGFPEKFYWEDK